MHPAAPEIGVRSVDLDNFGDRAALTDFVTGEDWPFHFHRRPDHRLVEEWIADGAYAPPENAAFWILRAAQTVGLMHLTDLQDIDDGEPLLNLRITAAARDRGIGTAAVRWLCGYAFDRWPTLARIGAETRVDNLAMRRVLHRCGFVKEAHRRLAWHSADGTRHDAIGYGLLRHDWNTATATPVNWDDEPLRGA
jgi:RimJ/RimL family protein N-acetyltransferase